MLCCCPLSSDISGKNASQQSHSPLHNLLHSNLSREYGFCVCWVGRGRGGGGEGGGKELKEEVEEAEAAAAPLAPLPPLRAAASRDPRPSWSRPAGWEPPFPPGRRRGAAQDGGGRAVPVWAPQVPGRGGGASWRRAGKAGREGGREAAPARPRSSGPRGWPLPASALCRRPRVG